MEHAIITINNVIAETRTAFGYRNDTNEPVFVPPKVSKAVGLVKGDTVQAKLVENQQPHTRKDPIKWLAAVVVRDFGSDVDVQSVRAALSVFDYPVEADETQYSVADLEVAHRLGEVAKVTISQSPSSQKIIMWTDDIHKV